MDRKAWRGIAAGLLPLLLAGCSSNPETDPLIAVGMVVGYILLFGFIGILVSRAIWGPL